MFFQASAETSSEKINAEYFIIEFEYQDPKTFDENKIWDMVSKQARWLELSIELVRSLVAFSLRLRYTINS